LRLLSVAISNWQYYSRVLEPYSIHVYSTITICGLIAAVNVVLAMRSISSGAAVAFAIAFGATGLTWGLIELLPATSGPRTGLSLLLVNACGALGMISMWCGFWLRAGRRINWWFMAGLFFLWLIPVLGVLILGLTPGTHVPFAVASICAGTISSIWAIYRKSGHKNAGDYALISWIAVSLPVTAMALLIGMSGGRSEPDGAWMFFLAFMPTLFTGIGLFTLLGFALDALHDSNQLARTDGLTELLNRRAFDSELGIALARAERYQRELSLVVVDIDNFKALNDNYGHPAGDAVIRAVARVLSESARRIDIVARIGGEEFALILADTPPSAALRLAERLRQAVIHASSDMIAFTASFGVASTQDTGTDSDAIMKAADDALYAAKKAGRNCVRYARDPGVAPAALIGLVKSPGR
jgi:diguanylate cyclase (GGDEF)-like protein